MGEPLESQIERLEQELLDVREIVLDLALRLERRNAEVQRLNEVNDTLKTIDRLEHPAKDRALP